MYSKTIYLLFLLLYGTQDTTSNASLFFYLRKSARICVPIKSLVSFRVILGSQALFLRMFLANRMVFFGFPLRCLEVSTPSNPFKFSDLLFKNPKSAKNVLCKYRKVSDLKNSFKKDWKGYCLIEKSDYFCTRNDAEVLINTGKLNETRLKIYFQKRFKKVCEK